MKIIKYKIIIAILYNVIPLRDHKSVESLRLRNFMSEKDESSIRISQHLVSGSQCCLMLVMTRRRPVMR